MGGSAASHFRWQAARGWPHSFGLQHPEGVDSSLGACAPRRRQEAQEETYTKPKKIKHKKKKVKLAVLKYYKVDENGKITRLRRECAVVPPCGAGVFLAHHHDRWYCGKCHRTWESANVTKDGALA